MENQLSPSAYYEDEQEINLVSLIFSVLHQYRIIIIAAVLCALIGCGAGLYKDSRTQKALEEGSDITTKESEEYNTALDEYNNSLETNQNQLDSYNDQLESNEKSQKNTEKSIEDAEEYIEKSVLNNIDPYELHTVGANLYIETDYKIMPGMDYQNHDYTSAVLVAYNNKLTGSENIINVAEQFGTEEKYLRELVSIWYDGNTRILYMTVKSGDAKTANAILDTLLAVAEDYKETVNTVVGSHTVSLLSRTETTTVDTNLLNSQQSKEDNLTNLNKKLDELKEKHTELEDNIKTTQETLDGLTEPAKPKMGASVAKFAVIGLVAGIFVGAAFAAVRFLLMGRVHSAADLKDNCRLAIIGALAGEGIHKAKGIDAWLYRLEKRPSPAADDEMLHLIASTVSSRAPQAESVLLTGDLPAERLNALCGALQASGELGGKKLAASESILKSAATVSKAMAADAIVLVADCAVTTYNSVNSQAEQLRNLGKGILGCIVYE